MAPALIRRATSSHSPSSSTTGASEISRLTKKLCCCTTGLAVMVTPLADSCCHSGSSAHDGRCVSNLV